MWALAQKDTLSLAVEVEVGVGGADWHSGPTPVKLGADV